MLLVLCYLLGGVRTSEMMAVKGYVHWHATGMRDSLL